MFYPISGLYLAGFCAFPALDSKRNFSFVLSEMALRALPSDRLAEDVPDTDIRPHLFLVLDVIVLDER